MVRQTGTGLRAVAAGLIAASALLASATTNIAGASACTQALTLRGWQPLIALARDVPSERAIALLRHTLRWQRIAARSTKLDPDVRALRNRLRARLRDFDLPGLYRVLPETHDDWHALTLAGRLTPPNYTIEQVEDDAFEQPLTSLGATRTRLGLRPLADPPDAADGDHYAFRIGLRAATGASDWASILRAQRLGLGLLSTRAPWPVPTRYRTATSDAYPALAAVDRPIVTALWAAFPNTVQWYSGIGAITRVRKPERAHANAQHLALTFELTTKKLRRHYPAVADYLARLDDLISVRVRLENAAGRWLAVDFDSEKRRLTLDAWVADGALIPSRHGVPVASRIRAHEPLTSVDYRSRIDVRLKALGVRVNLSDWNLDWHYQRAANGATFTGHARTKPRIDVGGHAFGVLPAGLLDSLSPVNLSGAIDDFTTALAASNARRGARLLIGFKNAGHGTLRAGLEAAVVNNFFVHYGMRLINHRVLATGHQLAGLKRLIGDGFAAFATDLDRFARVRERYGDSAPAKAADGCSLR